MLELLPSMGTIIGFIAAIILIKLAFWIINLRRVVSTNEVHIVQSSKQTTSYGKDTENGNTYYEFPAWLPFLGVSKIVLPVSVFDVDLSDYEAYDKGRLPFRVDIKSFFRISDSNLAAQRVASFDELHNQLKAIVQGAVRTILASNEIEEIMQGRATFGEQFTQEVSAQLTNWGVVAVKNIELMDIRDSQESRVILNIMDKKKSFIEMESRKEVAENNKMAEIAEIEAKRETDITAQLADQQVGIQTATKEREVGIAKEQSVQAIQVEQRTTKEREMAVIKVAEVNKAEIDKEVQLVKAEQDKQAGVIQAEGIKQRITINAEGEKAKAVLDAEALLETKKRESEGIALEGDARAGAEKAMQLAPVEAQIVLAKEIGANESYQQYLVTIRGVEANQAIGIAQAGALEKADIKIIANSGDVSTGISKVSDILSAKGGTNLGAMLEGLAQTETGKALLAKVTNSGNKESKKD